MPRLAKNKKKTLEKEAGGDGFEAISSVAANETTSLYLQKKSPRMATTRSKIAGYKKKSSKAATSTSEEPPSPEAGARKRPSEELVEVDKPKGKVTTLWQSHKLRECLLLMSLQARIPAHHPMRMVYPFASSAMLNAFVLLPTPRNPCGLFLGVIFEILLDVRCDILNAIYHHVRYIKSYKYNYRCQNITPGKRKLVEYHTSYDATGKISHHIYSKHTSYHTK
jgi:hypothetical protein